MCGNDGVRGSALSAECISAYKEASAGESFTVTYTDRVYVSPDSNEENWMGTTDWPKGMDSRRAAMAVLEGKEANVICGVKLG